MEQKMTKIEKFLEFLRRKIYLPSEFCCFSLRTGAKILGWIAVIMNPLFLLSFVCFLVFYPDHIDVMGEEKFLISAIFTFPTSLIDFLAAAWFLCGISSVRFNFNYKF